MSVSLKTRHWDRNFNTKISCVAQMNVDATGVVGRGKTQNHDYGTTNHSNNFWTFVWLGLKVKTKEIAS